MILFSAKAVVELFVLFLNSPVIPLRTMVGTALPLFAPFAVQSFYLSEVLVLLPQSVLLVAQNLNETIRSLTVERGLPSYEFLRALQWGGTIRWSLLNILQLFHGPLACSHCT